MEECLKMLKNKKNYAPESFKLFGDGNKEINKEIGFKDLNLSKPIMQAVADAGYENPTPVQAKAIPAVLAGSDLLAGAQTGTGKTAAFTLPILHLLAEKHAAASRSGKPRCLVLTPTRELAAQVEESVKTYGKYLPLKSTAVFGGMSIVPQIKALRRNVDILVATPGRLLDHVGQKTVDLSGVEIFVLDEADRMLDMGFIVDIKKIIALLPKQRQNLLFSATFSEKIKTLSASVLHNPVFVEGAKRNAASELVDQSVHLVSQRLKSHLLSHLIKHHKWKQVLIFTRTKNGANRLADKLTADGISASAIHGNKSQPARTKALAQFKDGSVTALVATDVASRGIDIDRLPHVINFELPNMAEDYVHRIGRTGRAGSSGKAISLVDKEELRYLKEIERFIKREIPKVLFDSFVPPANMPVAEPHNLLPQRQGGRKHYGEKTSAGSRNYSPHYGHAKKQNRSKDINTKSKVR
jgi:ATP-dependent RNA helicase RhlE